MYPHSGGSVSEVGTDDTKDISMVVKIEQQRGMCNELSSKLRGMQAHQATHYLKYTFDAQLEEVEMNGIWVKPQNLLKELPTLNCTLASEIAPLTFWGGPPGKKQWYQGSLLTMLIDHILCAVDAGNQGLLSRFTNLTL